jgi:biotin operon repressor
VKRRRTRRSALRRRELIFLWIARRDQADKPLPKNAVLSRALGCSETAVGQAINTMLDEGRITVPNSGTRERFYRVVR